MKLRKVLSLLVALAMMLEVLPLSLFANDMESMAEYTVSESVTVDASSLADNDELLEGYIEQLFGTGSNSGIMLAATYTGEDALDDVNLEVYTALKTAVANIASGAESSTVIAMTLTYDYSDFGVSTLEDAVTAFSAALDITSVVSYLLNDCPYELYWFDKTASVEIASSSISGSGTTMTVPLTVTMPVASAYQASGSTTTVDSSKVTAAQTAASYAQSLVSTYSSYSDEEKLEAFKEAICSLVSYETDYASADFGDIWQLVYVFDQDSATNVVCEGYSKAFQYLCDLAGLESIIVTGTMSGGTGAGEHMWNVVYLDGVNYLVDVTNSDTGSVGQDGGLFMVCADDADASDETGYTFTVNNQTVSYVYDSTTLGLYPEDYLTLGTVAETYYIDITTAENGTVETDASSSLGGETVTITVTPDDGYAVSGVTVTDANGNEVTVTEKSDVTYTFEMPASDVTITAVFEEESDNSTIYSIGVVGSDHVTVTLDKTSAIEGETVTMTMTPDDGYYITLWTIQGVEYCGNGYWKHSYVAPTLVSDNTYTFVMPAKDVEIEVEAGCYAINCEYGNFVGGYISVVEEYANAGDEVTFTVNINDGAVLSDLIAVDSEGNSLELTYVASNGQEWVDYEFVMPASDVTITATFEEELDDSTLYSIDIVSYEGNGTAVTDKVTATKGETVTLTVTPDVENSKVSLSIVYYYTILSTQEEYPMSYTDNGDGTYSFVMPAGDVEISLKVKQYSISTKMVGGHGGFSLSHVADEGETCKFGISPSYEYILSSYSVVDSEGNTIEVEELYTSTETGSSYYTFVMPASDVTITAVLEEVPLYQICIADVENGNVATSVASTAAEDETVTLIVTSGDGYILSSISVTDSDGNEVTITEQTDGTYTFEMPASDVTVSATFTKPSTTDEYTITVRDDFNVSYSVPSSANAGDEVTITFATDDSTDKVYVDVVSVLDYDSDGNSCWWEDYTSEMFGGDSSYSYTFTMPDYDVEIYFVVGQYTLTNVVNDADAGTVANDYLLAYGGETVNIWVHTNDGYTLSSLTATDASGNSLSISFVETYLYEYEYSGESRYYDIYEFTMPTSDVTITGVFEEIHTHTLTHVEATDATCTEDGNTEYWYCDDCDKYFSDEDAENEITLDDTVVEATGHDYGCDAATFTLSVSAYSLMGYAQSGDTLDITLPYSLSASDDVVLPVSYTLTVNGVTVSLKGSDGTGSGTYTQTVDIGIFAMDYSESGNAMIPQSTSLSGDIVVTAIVDCSAYGSDCTIDVSDIGSWDFEFGYIQAGATTGAGVNADGMIITKTYESTNVSWSWSDDYSSATATFTCKNDSSHTETADATVTSETTKEATCTATGSAVYTAVVDMDGTSYSDTKTVELPMVAHTEGEAVTENEVAATCTEDGSYESVVYCSVCGEELSRETVTVDATGHNYVATETSATCTEGGYTTYVCSECGDTYTDEETEALGHDYESVVTKEPTCTETGIMTYTCSRCGDSYTEEIDMIDHTYGEPEWTWVWSETEQTYTATAKFTCTVCGGTDTETALITSETTASTCIEQGSIVYTATVDMDGTPYSDTKTTSLPLANHTEGEAVTEKEVAATCTTDGSYDTVIYCTVCNEELSRETVTVPATGLHNYELTYTDPDTGDKTYTCSVCGETRVVKGSSSLTIDCTNYGVCWSEDTLFFHAGSWSYYETFDGDGFLNALAVDGAILAITRSDESGVVYDGVSNYENFILIDSWYTISPYIWLGTAGHTSADEPSKGIIDCISDDGYLVLYDANEVYNAYVAAGGLKGGDPLLITNTSGSYDVTNIKVYYPESVTHTWDDGVVTTEAICTEEGVMTYTCTVCGETKTEAIPAKGHSLEHVEATDATCTTDGNKEYWACTACGELFSDENGTTAISTTDTVVPATGHTTETQNAKDATCTEGGYTTYTCTVCGDTYTADETPATGHTTEIRNAVDATCTEDGYTGDEVCTVCGETITVGTVIPATGHSYGEPTFEWAEDYSSATATFVCTNDETHVETVDATVTSSTTDPTCEVEGSIVYTATVDFNGSTYTDEKAETIPATGHDYVLSSWTWSADYSSATAMFVCANDSTHVEDIAAALTSETTEATESTYGKTVYTASVTVDGVTYTSSQIDTDNSVVVDEDCNVYDVEASDTGDSGTYFENDSTASVAIQVDGAAIEIEYDTAVDSEIEISITSGGVTYTFNITVSGSRKSSMISVADIIAEAESAGTTLDLSNFEYLTVSSADATIGTVSVLSSTGTTEHTYETVTIEPTCYSEGSITYTCTVCGETYTETLEKIAHTEGEQVIENRVEATRTTDGSYDLVTYCSVCGEEISRETVVIPATGGVDMMTIWLRTPANYTSVNEAIANANALNPDDYSNFADVTAAIDAINWNLNILCQSIVDGYAKTIETAIASLVPVGMTTEEVVVEEPIEDTNTDTEDDVF